MYFESSCAVFFSRAFTAIVHVDYILFYCLSRLGTTSLLSPQRPAIHKNKYVLHKNSQVSFSFESLLYSSIYTRSLSVFTIMKRNDADIKLDEITKCDDSRSVKSGATTLSAKELENIRSLKDGTRAWIACFASFLIQVWVVGVLHAYGVFFVAFLEEFDCANATAGKRNLS